MPASIAGFFMEINDPILIVGQGIAGTLLSFELYQKGIPFKVIDTILPGTASYTSGAVLNPFSGKTGAGISRRSAMYDVAISTYKAMEKMLACPIIKESTLVFFDSDREDQPELRDRYDAWFQQSSTIHECRPVALVDNASLLQKWRSWLLQHNLLSEEWFEETQLRIEDQGIQYKGQFYHKIIFCNGVQAHQSGYFAGLRFTRNRGDVLHLEIKGLPENVIFNKGKLRLIPRGADTYWCGSNYNWNFSDPIPDEEWKQESLSRLQSWLKLPFRLIDHICAERPTTVGQIPFVGWHPQYPQLGICNGLGTKGFSAGPLWIHNWVTGMVDGAPGSYQHVLDKFLS